MGTIKISYSELETKIFELQTMRTDWNNYATKIKPELSGGGMTITVADEVAEAYVKLYKAVCTLCDNTISFMENVKKSVSNTDEEAAEAMK